MCHTCERGPSEVIESAKVFVHLPPPNVAFVVASGCPIVRVSPENLFRDHHQRASVSATRPGYGPVGRISSRSSGSEQQ